MRITLPVATTLLACGGLLTGCGGGAAVPARAAGSPAVTRRQAAQILAQYQATNNKANRSLNAGLLATVEAGPQLAMDTAGYKLDKVTKTRLTDFGFVRPTFYIPRLAGWPRWFAVDATSTGDTGTTGAKTNTSKAPPHHTLLFRQDAGGSPWRLAADPYVTSGRSPLAGVALDRSGYAMPVSPDTGKLRVAPSRLAPAHANLLTSGPTAPGASALAAGPQTTQAYQALRQARGGFAKLGVTLSTRFAPSAQPSYALRTTDGGAVVWYVLQQQETYASRSPGVLSVTGDLVGLAPAGKVAHKLDTTVLIQYLAKIPASGAATVSGMYRKAVQATAS